VRIVDPLEVSNNPATGANHHGYNVQEGIEAISSFESPLLLPCTKRNQ
jgi:hypothetical protein